MIFNAIVALLVLIIPVIWSTKAKGYGMFSAFLAAVCTLAAGAIAFALWEPASYTILGWGSGTSFVASVLQTNAFGLGLLLPFMLAMLILRLAVDSVVKANVDFSDTANMAGGLLFGAVNALITVGILVISLGYMHLPKEMLGYSPIEERQGMPVYARRLWVPVDLWTTRLYENLSHHAFWSPTPLAEHLPNVYEAAGMQRITFKDATRNTVLPDQYQILGAYKISGPLGSLLVDAFLVSDKGDVKKQSVLYPDATAPAEGATLYGYAIKFNSGAKEKGGNVVITPSQLRLVCRDDEGNAKAIHPIAVVAPPEAASAGLYRFRFDAVDSVISSLGGGADASFIFEFLVPPGMRPEEMFVKNIRTDVGASSALKEFTYADYRGRDKAIEDASILGGFGIAVAGASGGELDKSASKPAPKTDKTFDAVETGNELPIGMIFNKTNRGSMEVNDKNEIVNGDHTMDRKQLFERGLDKNLRVDKFATSADTGIIKLELAKEGGRSDFGRAVETAEATQLPVLVDNRGARYEPIGFVYDDGETVRIHYNPGLPIKSLGDLPALSRTKRSQSLYLVYRPTKGLRITSFALGNKEILSFPGGIEVR